MRGVGRGWIGSGTVGFANLLVNLQAMHRRRRWCHDAKTDPVAADAKHPDLDPITDDDRFATTAREHEHGAPIPWDGR